LPDIEYLAVRSADTVGNTDKLANIRNRAVIIHLIVPTLSSYYHDRT